MGNSNPGLTLNVTYFCYPMLFMKDTTEAEQDMSRLFIHYFKFPLINYSAGNHQIVVWKSFLDARDTKL